MSVSTQNVFGPVQAITEKVGHFSASRPNKRGQRNPQPVVCTNRLTAIDPAVPRRAAEIFDFRLPNDEQRRAVLEGPLREAGFSPAEVERIVQKSGPSKAGAIGFTFSDLTQRFLPTLMLDA